MSRIQSCISMGASSGLACSPWVLPFSPPPVGYSWSPLLKDGRMQSVEIQLPAAAALQPGYLGADRGPDAKKVRNPGPPAGRPAGRSVSVSVPGFRTSSKSHSFVLMTSCEHSRLFLPPSDHQ